MRIAVDISSLYDEELLGYDYFLRTLIHHLATTHVNDEFILISATDPATASFPANVSGIVVRRTQRNVLSLKWWLDVKLPLALKSYNVDIVVSTNHCSLTINLPQLLIIKNFPFLLSASTRKKAYHSFYEGYFSKFTNKAKLVATTTNVMAKEIAQQYHLPGCKIKNIGIAVSPVFKPVSWQEREAIKETFAEGQEYFLLVARLDDDENLLSVFKAYSQFKIRQRSSMRLIIIANTYSANNFTKLDTYKFKDEVKVLSKLCDQDYAAVIAAAYALLYSSNGESLRLPLLAAMQCEVPIITPNDNSSVEIAGDAALYVSFSIVDSLADQLKVIYKDESLRSELIKKGIAQATNYGWDKTAGMMWEAIEQAVS